MKTFTKFVLATVLMLTISMSSYSQTPQAFVYQSSLSDTSGAPLSNQLVSLKVSILQGSASGSSVYSETHNVTTTSNGYININIGQGSVVSGTFNTIDWGSNSHFMKVELDVTGGSSFMTMGVTQLLSVPYALNAGSVSNSKIGFSAYFSDTTTTIPSGTIKFPNVTFNDGNAYDASTGLFTVPTTGVYLVVCNARAINLSGLTFISIKVNGTNINVPVGPSNSYDLNTPLKLMAGDVVDVSITSSDDMYMGSRLSIVKIY